MAAATMRPAVDSCPDLETIAAYLDHRLTERERAGVAEHLASCETCYFVLSEAAQVRASAVLARETNRKLGEPASAWRWPGRTVLWSSAAGLAAAASLVVAVGVGVGRRGSDSPELRALVVAVGTDRTIEPRLTGGFAFGPLRGPVRSAAPAPTAVSPDVRIAAARIEKEATTDRSPRSLRALGLAYLVSGDIGRAVPVLEEAAETPGSDARTFSDLSAAYFERAARNGDRQDLMKALAAAERALGADPRLAEAWFNRAKTLERLSLVAPARDAWREYLKIDGDSPWAGEARAHLSALER